MLEHEGRARKGARELRAERHLRGKDLKLEQQAAWRKLRQSASPLFIGNDVGPWGKAVIRIFMPMHLLADALEPCKRPHGVEGRADIGPGEIGEAGDGMRKAILEVLRVGNRLHPGDLFDIARRIPVGLDIDRGDDAIVFDVGEIFGDRIVAADRVVGAENARHHRPVQPRLIRLAPDVMMGIDQVETGHGASHSGQLLGKRQAAEKPARQGAGIVGEGDRGKLRKHWSIRQHFCK